MGDKMSKSNSFFKMEMLLLKILEEKDCYGYEIVQSIKKLSNDNIKLQEGTMYPILYKLEEKNYISSQRVLVGKRLSRVYYHLETKGKLYLQEIYDDYKNMITVINNIMEGKNNE